MPFLSSLPEDAGVRHAMALNPEAGRALVHLHTAVMRGPSPLTAAERELLAAYVSALNGCRYCHGVHAATARHFGIAEGLLEAMVTDLESAPLPDRLRPIMAYARKLTLTPGRMTAADARAVIDAGWDERTLHDAVAVVCLFNFMNRFAEGHGIKGDAAMFEERGRELAEGGYDPLLKLMERPRRG